MNLPQSENLSVVRMGRIFDNTVATYKFYWFMGILDLFVKRGIKRINFDEIMIEMVVSAWYSVCYFHLSFGKSESLYDAIFRLKEKYNISINISSVDLRMWLQEHINDKDVRVILHFLKLNVPYRFLRPWIDTNDNKAVVERSMTFENDCLYRLIMDGSVMWVELNDKWLEYLQDNYIVLKGFAYWNLALFLQIRNPNVPNIPNKLVKNEMRNSLGKQHAYWDFAMECGLKVNCIYTGKSLEKGNYDLDHFIPWSFVSHDLLWNLLPADGSINSSKNDKLPNLDIYLPKLALIQQQAIKVCLTHNYRGKTILEDYLSFGCTPQELADMSGERLIECFYRVYNPLNQIALNMGFETWKY